MFSHLDSYYFLNLLGPRMGVYQTYHDNIFYSLNLILRYICTKGGIVPRWGVVWVTFQLFRIQVTSI